MAEGVFQKVELEEGLKVVRKVEGFLFYISRLPETDKVFLEVVIPRSDEELRIEALCLLPEWVFSRMKTEISLRDAISFASCGEDEIMEYFLCEAAKKLEKILTLEIGRHNYNEIYFTIRFKAQEVSIWDRVLSVESLKGFIEEEKK